MEFSRQDLERLNDNSLYRLVGIVVDEVEDGRARSRLRPNPDLCWPFEEQPHGGVLFTLMDTTMAWAVLTKIEKGNSCATIDLDIHYTRPARGELYTCSAWVTHQAGRTIFARADILDEGGRLVAAGQAVFRVVKTPFDA